MVTARQGRQCSGRFDYIVTFGDGGFILDNVV